MLPLLLTAQITISAQLPPGGMIQKDQLWNLVLVNNRDDVFDVGIRMNLQDGFTGELVMSANTGTLLLSKGVRIIQPAEIQPILYNYNRNDFSKSFLPMGTYVACYQLYHTGLKGEEPIADECIKFNIDPLSPPLLSAPADKSEVPSPYPLFAWMPPTPFELFNNLSYEILLTEVFEGQSPSVAIQNNTPLYSKTNISQPYDSYSSSFNALQPGKTYAWQVIAKNESSYAAKTEVWTFKVQQDSIERIISLAPYVKLNKSVAEISIVHQGILKMELINNQKDSIGNFIVRNISSKDEKQAIEFKMQIHINAGQNFIQFDMNKYRRLRKNDVYEVEYINYNNQSLFLKFVPVYYR